MKTNLLVKKVDDLTEDEYKRCLSLSFREDGNLYYDLYRYRRKLHRGTYTAFIPPKKPAWVIMIKSNDTILSWCLMAPDKPQGRYVAQFYTRREYRGRGLGSIIMREALKIDPKPYVYPHDTKSAGLFKKYKNFVRYDRTNREYREAMK